MRKYFFALTLLLCSLTAMAQERKDTVVITLRNGTEVRYTSDKFDRVQIIYNLRYGVKVYLKNGKSKDYLATEVRIAKYQSGGEVVADNNRNRNLYRAKLLEYPHLAEDSTMNQLIIKSTPEFGITYSAEWSYRDKANRWSCYQMYKNMLDTASRNNDFYEDEEIPEQYRSKLADYKSSGFSRGHLCPSADRRCSDDQNKQTFFLSNIQPQWQNHNGVLWSNFEKKVRDWADICDTLYVVKAATIRSDQVYEEKCNGKLLVPRYFYMALLAYYKETDKYEAMALWTVHEDKSVTGADFKDYAISIDELEELTGIDFFCNLPDDIEDEVERECHKDKWKLPE
jgi:endonuclease G